MLAPMSRRRIAVVLVLAAALAAGLAWWFLGRGGAPKKPTVAAADDPWGDSSAGDRALAAKKRAARGDTPVDSSPGSLSGHVRRAADGSGVAGAVVSVTERQFAGAVFGAIGGGAQTLVAVTDAAGAWRIDAVPPGRRVVTATAVELLPASIEVSVAPRTDKTGVDLSLAAGGITVGGTVSDIGGGPIADARVTIRPGGLEILDSSAELVAITGDDGRYRMTLPADSWHATAAHDDYASEDRAFVVRTSPVTLDFTLTPGGTVRGTVIARDTGKPVGGARVIAGGGHGGRDDDIPGIGGVPTADDGTFTLRGLGSGALSLSATGRGYSSTDPTVVEVGIGEEVAGVTVMVDRAYTISGFVVRRGTKGDGIPGVRVGVFSIARSWAAFAQQPSAPDGYFEIVGVRPASYMIAALGDDVMLEIGKSITVDKADLTDVIVTMDDGVTLSGRVSPPAEARLALSIDAEDVGISKMFDVARAAMVRGSSDAAGNFTLRNTPKGSFTIVAETADGRSGALPVTIADVDQTGLVVELEERGAISGRVLDANRSPVAGVEVEARSTGKNFGFSTLEGGAGETVTAPDGTFRVAGLEAGEVELTVSDEHGELAWADPAAATNPAYRVTKTIQGTEELRDVELVVEARDGVIRGVVLGLDRAPMPDVWVTARSQENPWARQIARAEAEAKKQAEENAGDGTSGGVQVRVETDDDDDDSGPRPYGPGKTVLTGPDGRFVIKELRRGVYDVIADATKGGVRALETGVKTGESVTLVVEKLGVLTGVVRSAGTPVASYDLSCDGPADDVERHVNAADGRYRLERLPAGTYKCRAAADAGSGKGEVKLTGESGTLDLELGAWASITGVVVDDKGAPMVGLVVIAGGEGDDRGSAFAAVISGEGPRTDAAGRFEVGRLSPGKGDLMVFDPGEGMTPIVNKDFTLTAGQRLDLGKLTGADRPRVPGAPDAQP